MNLRLQSLRTIGLDRCLAEIGLNGGDIATVEFVVSRQNGITSATPTPDIFVQFDGTADELRQLVAAVAVFCDVASGPRDLGGS